MKNNKLFWPIVLISIVVIVESVIFLSRTNKNNQSLEVVNTTPTMVEKETIGTVTPISEADISFYWKEQGNHRVLMLVSKNDQSLGAIDLYVNYKGMEISNLKNAGVLPAPVFIKDSRDKFLIVANYLIVEKDGYKLTANKEIGIVEFDIKPLSPEASLSIDSKTNLVENSSAKVLPYLSK